MTRSPAANIGFAKAGVMCFYDSFMLNRSAVLRLNICAKKPRLRKAEKRCAAYKEEPTHKQRVLSHTLLFCQRSDRNDKN